MPRARYPFFGVAVTVSGGLGTKKHITHINLILLEAMAVGVDHVNEDAALDEWIPTNSAIDTSSGLAPGRAAWR